MAMLLLYYIFSIVLSNGFYRKNFLSVRHITSSCTVAILW